MQLTAWTLATLIVALAAVVQAGSGMGFGVVAVPFWRWWPPE